MSLFDEWEKYQGIAERHTFLPDNMTEMRPIDLSKNVSHNTTQTFKRWTSDDDYKSIEPHNMDPSVLTLKTSIAPSLQLNPENNDAMEFENIETGLTTIPLKPSNLRILPSSKKTGKYHYVFHPGDGYGDRENWLDQHQMAMAVYMRNEIVDFARSVEGNVGGSAKRPLLKTGFEDALQIMYDAMQRTSNLPYGSQANVPIVKQEGEQQIDFEEELEDVSEDLRKEFASLTQLLRRLGATTNDVLTFWRNQRSMTQEAEFAKLRWLTLPYHVKNLYFSPELKAATESALKRILEMIREVGNIKPEDLFSDILAGDQRVDFVELVSDMIRLKRYQETPYNRKASIETAATKEIDNKLVRFSDYRPIPNMTQMKPAFIQ